MLLIFNLSRHISQLIEMDFEKLYYDLLADLTAIHLNQYFSSLIAITCSINAISNEFY